jgi:acyl-coenzyme A synthetase/AMP-(fatty) acid ligase
MKGARRANCLPVAPRDFRHTIAGMTAAIPFRDIIARHARERPDAAFVQSIDQKKSMTYRALAEVGDGLAALLSGRGLKANDRVLLLAENSVEFHAVFAGVLRYGATIVTVNVDMNRAHLQEIIAAVRPALSIYQPGLELEAQLQTGQGVIEIGEWNEHGPSSGLFADIERASGGAQVRSVASPDDHAVIFYTSGTVAKPKGVIQTHATAYFNYDATADYLELSPGMRVFDCRSFAWLSAQHMALGAPLVAGATAVIARRFSASRYLSWLRDHDIEIGFVVPTMVNMMLGEPTALRGTDLPRLRFLTCSSAPLYVEPWRAFESTFGITLCQSGGSSEGGNTAAHRGARRKLGTLGPPLKYQTLRILDDDQNEVARGEIGEIVLSGGRQQAHGYLLSNGSIERLPADGHHTGDLGRIDEDGHLMIVGRKKEIIVRGGVKIAPPEVDAVLYEIPGVAEAAVAGVPDAIWGEEVAGFLAPAAGVTLEESAVLLHCRERLPEAKAPKSIMLLQSLPKNARGKIDRAALVEMWRNRIGPAQIGARHRAE